MVLGPPKITGLNFLLKVLSGLTGGIIGSLVLFAIFLLNASTINPVLKNTGDQIHPLFIIIFLGMIFLASLTANLSAPTFITLADSRGVSRISTMLYQIFIANLLLFLLITPIYLLAWRLNLQWLAAIAAAHVIISSQASSLIVKIISTPRYALLGVYSSMLAILVGLGLNVILYQLSAKNVSVLLFGALPILWFCLSFFQAVSEAAYYGIYGLYGTDFLSTRTPYGSDQGLLDEEEKVHVSEEDKEKLLLAMKKDEKGEEFLQGKK